MTAILAFLKLIPVKDWLYAAAIALLLGLFTWYTIHERHEGAEKIEQKDAALQAAAIALNKASESLADIKELNVGKVYEKYITLPPIVSTGSLVCKQSAPVQPSAPADRSEDHGTAAVVPSGGFDPTGPILTLLSDDDAQIAALISTVKILVDELNGKH